MDIHEVTRLVGRIAITDNRTIDPTVILDWEQILPEWLTLDIAMRAVIEHRRNSTEYLQPAHIIAIATKLMEQDQARLPSRNPLDEIVEAKATSISRAEYAALHPEDADKLPTWWLEPPKPREWRGRRNPTRIFQAADEEPDEGPADAEPGV